jgi:colanic acid/amylovoran biosynthesis protein
MVIGTRFHSVIFSLTSHVPAIAIEYEHKTGGIMKDLDLTDWVLKIEEVNQVTLCRMVDQLIKQRADYQMKLQRIMPNYVKGTRNAIGVVADVYAKASLGPS